MLLSVNDITTVEGDRSLLDVVQILEQKQLQDIIVLDQEQKLLGLIEKTGIISILQQAQA